MKRVLLAVFFILTLLPAQSLNAGGAVAARRGQVPPEVRQQLQQQAQQQAQQLIQRRAAEQQLLQRQQQAVGQVTRQIAIDRANLHAQIQAQTMSGLPPLELQGQGVGNVNAYLAQDAIDPSQVREVVEIQNVWDTMGTSSYAWSLLMERRAKALTVAKYIDNYRQEGIIIRKDPVYYAQMIDTMAAETPEMLNQPFERILQVVAIIEYDFDNGMNKDSLARQVLGEQGFRNNRRRLGLE